VFGFVGAGFAILLGFVVLLTFEGYSGAKSHAEQEATAVFDQYEIAALVQPTARRDALRGDLVCYARAVATDELAAMEHGGRSALVATWLDRLEEKVRSSEIATRAEASPTSSGSRRRASTTTPGASACWRREAPCRRCSG
jgi:hypothetical protein